MEFLSEDLDEYLKDPSAVLVAKEAIKRAADNRPLPIKVLFVNKIDKNDNKEYETLDEALASVKDNPYIMAFASDPKAVFKQIWRVVNADGSLGGKVSEDAVDHFIDSFDGDKKALRAKLGRPEQRQQNQQKAYNKPNQGDGKKGNKPGKPNKPSDNSTSLSLSPVPLTKGTMHTQRVKIRRGTGNMVLAAKSGKAPVIIHGGVFYVKNYLKTAKICIQAIIFIKNQAKSSQNYTLSTFSPLLQA